MPVTTVPHEPTLPVYEPFAFKGIKGTPEDFHLPVVDAEICALVEAVVSKEGPISIGLLARRVAEHWGISRVTARVVKRVDELVRRANIKVTADDLSKRDAEDLCPIEVANGVHYLLEQHVRLPVADLVKETARLFGYQRIGQNVDKAIRSGIEVLVWSGRAKDEGGVVVCR